MFALLWNWLQPSRMIHLPGGNRFWTCWTFDPKYPHRRKKSKTSSSLDSLVLFCCHLGAVTFLREKGFFGSLARLKSRQRICLYFIIFYSCAKRNCRTESSSTLQISCATSFMRHRKKTKHTNYISPVCWVCSLWFSSFPVWLGRPCKKEKKKKQQHLDSDLDSKQTTASTKSGTFFMSWSPQELIWSEILRPKFWTCLFHFWARFRNQTLPKGPREQGLVDTDPPFNLISGFGSAWQMFSNQLRQREFNPPPYVTHFCTGELNVSSRSPDSNHSHSLLLHR